MPTIENIDDQLGGDYVLVNSIEGDNAEIDDASVDGDEAFGARLAAAVEPIDLTLDDTDEETCEFEGHYTNKLRKNKRLFKKLHQKNNYDPADISHTFTASDDDSSVMSRFSVNELDRENESSAKPPAKKLTKKMPAKKSVKKPTGKKLPTRASMAANGTTMSKNTSYKGKKIPAKGKKLFVKNNCKPLSVAPIITNYSFPVVREEIKDVYYLMVFFGEKMLVDKKQYSPKQKKSPVKRVTVVNGMKYKLFYSKFVTRKGRSYTYEDSMSQKYYKSYYIGVSDGGGAKLSITEELLRIADFESLAYTDGPEKVIARLSLLVSPACKSPDSHNNPLVHKLKSDLFKVIKDNGHEGCGFIPRPLLAALLGTSKRAKESIAIQVRLFSPTGFGIAKGMLMVKENIDEIEIPTSMIKVNKSASEDPLHDGVVLIISSIYPSVPAKVVGRIIDDFDSPTATQLKEVEPPSEMFQNVMLAKGVTKEALDHYVSNFQEDKNNATKHASLVGVADPTDSIPSGSVFITGMNKYQAPQRVFLTRSPCTEASDGMVVRVCGEEDLTSFSDDWDFLSSLPFGTVVFPLGEPSLPSTINSSDLDGDKFFAIWDLTIVNQAQNNDAGCLDDQFAICDDELVGITFRHQDDDGEFHKAEVLGREVGGERYRVALQSPILKMIVLSREEIMDGRRFMTRVFGHRVKGGKTVFQVEYGGKSKEDVLCRNVKEEFSTPPEVLNAYVKANKLHKTIKDCKWFEQHLGSAVPLKIIWHRNEGKRHEVLVEYDDGDSIWEPLSELLVDSRLLVGKYAKEQGLGEKDDEWKWAANCWLREIQESIFVQREYEVGLLISRTFGMWKKACADFGPNSVDALIWGRAYKDANELVKHGGRVKLPLMFYHQIVGKKAKDCKFISLLEALYGNVETAASSAKNNSFSSDNEEHVVLSDKQNTKGDGWGRATSSVNVESGRQVDVEKFRDSNSGWGRQSRDESAHYSATKTSTINLASGWDRSSGMSPVNTAAVTTDGWNRSASTKANPVTPTNASNSGWGRAAIGGDMNKEPKNDSGWGRSPGHTSAGTGASSSQGWNNNGMDKESVLGWDRSTAVGSKSQDSNNESGWGRPPANLSAGVDATNNCVNVNEKAGDSGWGRSTATGSKIQDSNNDSGWGRSPANLSAGIGATGSQGWDNTGVNDEAGDSGWGRSTATGITN